MNTMANLPIADAGILIIYFLVYVLIVIVGVIGLLKNYKKISLLKDNLIKKPYITSLINVGMICFYIYVINLLNLQLFFLLQCLLKL